MKNIKYEKIADRHKAKETRIKNCLISFISGGMIGLLGELAVEIIQQFSDLNRNLAITIVMIFLIFLASLLTALGVYDKLVQYLKCGLLIPITGFAHSMTSSSLDYKKEGLIYGTGFNMFKLAGSVIIYGVVSATIFSLIRYLLGVVL